MGTSFASITNVSYLINPTGEAPLLILTAGPAVIAVTPAFMSSLESGSISPIPTLPPDLTVILLELDVLILKS